MPAGGRLGRGLERPRRPSQHGLVDRRPHRPSSSRPCRGGAPAPRQVTPRDVARGGAAPRGHRGAGPGGRRPPARGVRHRRAQGRRGHAGRGGGQRRFRAHGGARPRRARRQPRGHGARRGAGLLPRSLGRDRPRAQHGPRGPRPRRPGTPRPRRPRPAVPGPRAGHQAHRRRCPDRPTPSASCGTLVAGPTTSTGPPRP